MINKDQERKDGIETSMVSPSDEPNPMCYHKNKLLSYDEVSSKASKPYHTGKIRLVTNENIFVCRA